jgi:inner membrane protein
MNWKGHTIFGIILGLPFLSSPEQIFLLVAGALYPDLDHNVKSEIVERGIYFSGSLVLIDALIYIFKPHYFDLGLFIGAVSVLLVYLIPHFANHRGITHTFLSLIVISLILGFLTYKMSILSPIIAGIIALIMVTNDKLLGKVISICVFVWMGIYLIISDVQTTLVSFSGMWNYIIPIGLGYLSHIIGDSLTPAGCNALYPLDYKFHKKEAVLFIIAWFLIVVYLLYVKYTTFY